jgi:serine/threonine-protein kinase RsbW
MRRSKHFCVNMEKSLPQKSISFVIISRFENISLVGIAIKAICESMPLDDILCHDIELCIVEATTNAIKHAYNTEPNHNVDIEMDLYINKIVFKVSDKGKPMDPKKCYTGCENLDFDPEKLETLPVCGMGLHIINSIMDEVDYESTDNRNTLIMTKIFKKV